jgi:hypothetical protein
MYWAPLIVQPSSWIQQLPMVIGVSAVEPEPLARIWYEPGGPTTSMEAPAKLPVASLTTLVDASFGSFVPFPFASNQTSTLTLGSNPDPLTVTV